MSEPDPHRAARALRTLADEAPEFVPAWVSAGDRLVQDGRTAAARRIWLRGLRHGLSAVLLERIAALDEAAGEQERTVRLFEKLSERHPGDATLALHLAKLLVREGRPEQANEVLDRIPADRRTPSPPGVRAASAHRQGDIAAAADSFAHALGPRSRLDASLALRPLRGSRSRVERAVRDLRTMEHAAGATRVHHRIRPAYPRRKTISARSALNAASSAIDSRGPHGADFPSQHEHVVAGEHLRRALRRRRRFCGSSSSSTVPATSPCRASRAKAAGAVQPQASRRRARASTVATATPASRCRRLLSVPPTKTCMNCHAQIWAQSPYLEPVRGACATNESIFWIKVNDLPDFVYFNHSAHVTKGVGCVDLSRARRPDEPALPGARRCRWSGASTAIAIPSSTCGRVNRSSTWRGSRRSRRRSSGASS